MIGLEDAGFSSDVTYICRAVVVAVGGVVLVAVVVLIPGLRVGVACSVTAAVTVVLDGYRGVGAVVVLVPGLVVGAGACVAAVAGSSVAVVLDDSRVGCGGCGVRSAGRVAVVVGVVVTVVLVVGVAVVPVPGLCVG